MSIRPDRRPPSKNPSSLALGADLIEYADLAAYVNYRNFVKTITPGIGKSNDDLLESAGIARFLGVEHVVANLAGPTSVFRSHTSRSHQPWSGPNAKKNSLRVGRLAFRIASVHRYTCAWIQGVMLSGTVYPVDLRKHWGGRHFACLRPQVGSLPPNSRFSSTAHERANLASPRLHRLLRNRHKGRNWCQSSCRCAAP